MTVDMTTVKQMRSILRKSAKRAPGSKAKFYKTGSGQYAEHDQFIGVSVPVLRKLAQEFKTLSRVDIQLLLESSFNEERLLALLILNNQYKQGDLQKKKSIYEFYMDNLKHINNWNLVDSSAHLIIGAHLLNSKKNILISLSKSDVMWERRIAIVATWIFIRNDQCDWTIKIAKILLNDPHDLIHKAVGWMLREAGKRDIQLLKDFLDQYAGRMPRTMLRYAIEKFPQNKRKKYLLQ